MGKFSDALGKVQKVDNHQRSMPDKTMLRQNVLDEVKAPVFDAFAGSGEMFRRVWHAAPGYVGCDLRWFPDDPRLAYVADNRRVLRCVDLNEFGIFDLDAYGSPWYQLAIIAARRAVKPGERIGFAITEGSSLKLKMGDAPKALSYFAKLQNRPPGLASSHDELINRAIRGLCEKMNCRLARAWRARGKTGAKVIYLGLVLEGLPLNDQD